MSVEEPEALELSWDMVLPLIEGRSAIDVPRLYLRSRDEAREFLLCYGFDLEVELHRRQLDALREEAWAFIEEELLYDEPHLRPPEAVRTERDICALLLMASTAPRGDEGQLWACSLLRVLHTFAHCGSYFKQWFGGHIRRQILNRFEPHLHRDEEGLTLGSGPDAIPLERFEIKGSKSRRSLAMKLLHKADNVAADIFDWIGVRFVTRERYDTLLVAQYLRKHSIVMFAHVKPGRSRNTLVEVDRLQRDIRKLAEGKMVDGLRGVSRQTLRELVRRYPYPRPPERGHNVFTSVAYHSLQFTVSQQVVVEGGTPEEVVTLFADLAARYPEHQGALDEATRRLALLNEARFLFPYEVQITDQTSYDLSQSGLAAHDVYKVRQRHAVKRRLWGERIAPEPKYVRSA